MSLGHCRKTQVMGSFTAAWGGHLFKSSSASLFFYAILVGECNEDMWTSIHISAEQHSGKGRTEASKHQNMVLLVLLWRSTAVFPSCQGDKNTEP